MRNKRTIVAAAAALCLGVASVGFGADIVGTVADTSGAPIPGVTVSVGSQTGTHVGTATSDSLGRYAIRGLQPGTYTFSARGQSAVSYVGDNGLTVDWGVPSNAPPIATAHAGSGSADAQAEVSNRLIGFAAKSDGNSNGDNGNCQGDNNNGNGQGKNGNGNCDKHKHSDKD